MDTIIKRRGGEIILRRTLLSGKRESMRSLPHLLISARVCEFRLLNNSDKHKNGKELTELSPWNLLRTNNLLSSAPEHCALWTLLGLSLREEGGSSPWTGPQKMLSQSCAPSSLRGFVCYPWTKPIQKPSVDAKISVKLALFTSNERYLTSN